MQTELRLAGLVGESIVDGPGLRMTVFCQGCPHRCRGCHNPETWPSDGGKTVSIRSIADLALKNPMLKGITFSGGEPFCQAGGSSRLAEIIKAESSMDIVVFTGYTYEQLQVMAEKDGDVKTLLELSDLLIDGPFIEKEKNLTLQFRGSSNQRIIDMNETRRTGRMILAREYMGNIGLEGK